MKPVRPIAIVAGLAALTFGCQSKPTPSPSPSPAPANRPAAAPGATPNAGGAAAQPGGGGGGGGAGGQGGEPTPRPYAQVIRGAVTTKSGLFKTHMIGSTLYFEIPAAELGKDLLLITQIAKNVEGDGYGGAPLDERVVRWERRGNRVLFRSVSYATRADPETPIAEAVANCELRRHPRRLHRRGLRPRLGGRDRRLAPVHVAAERDQHLAVHPRTDRRLAQLPRSRGHLSAERGGRGHAHRERHAAAALALPRHPAAARRRPARRPSTKSWSCTGPW